MHVRGIRFNALLEGRRLALALLAISFLIGTCILDAGAGHKNAHVKSAIENSARFEPGSVFTYKLKWSFLSVGQATLRTNEREVKNGQDCNHFSMNVRTCAWVDKFYKVRTEIHSWTQLDLSRSEHYVKKQLEGKTHRDIEVSFDWDKGEVVYSNWGETLAPVKLENGAMDPLSIMFYFRRLDLAPGGVYHIPVTDGKKVVNAKINVLGVETVKTPAGKFECYKVSPDIKDLGGIFKKSKKASITFWLTKDEYKYPVKFSSKVRVGSFSAYATSLPKSTKLE